MSLENDAERGRLAEAVLDNPVYRESFDLIEQGLIRAWRDCRDKAEREDLHKLLRMLDKTRNTLESTMRSGKVAAEDLRQKQGIAQRVLRRFEPA